MNNGNYSLGMRFNYWFDNKMAQGFWNKVRLLLIVTLAFILIVGTLAAIAHGGIQENFVDDFIRTFMYSIGKGGALSVDDAHSSVIYFILMLLTIIYCMFFSAILIGLISNALRTKVDDLGKGHSQVIEYGHTLILGFNDATYVLLGELIEANKNQRKPQTIVILGSTDRSSMIEQIYNTVGKPTRGAKTRIICRTGSLYNFEDLRRCSIETSRAIIINASTDFESVKATMACSYILAESQIPKENLPFIVSVIQNTENLIESRLVTKASGKDSLIVLALDDVLARIMVHTSRQPGLSDVFTELFNFSSNEFYIFNSDPSFPQFYGKCLAEINHFLKDSFAVGLIKKDSGITFDNPLTTVFEDGDSLIVIKEDDDPIKVLPASPVKHISPDRDSTPQGGVNVLIIGVEPVLNSVLMEYANYLSEGSSICIVDHNGDYDSTVTDTTKDRLKNKNIELSINKSDVSQKRYINDLLSNYPPDCVLVLAKDETNRPDIEDEKAMRTLIYLREYRDRTGKYFSITCEMLQSKNKNLAEATGSDDFIISRQLSALLMSQISQNRDMSSLFEDLLSSKGYEIYMKPANWYVPTDTPIDLISVGQIVAEVGEVFMGIRQFVNGRYQTAEINPTKYESNSSLKQYTFSEDDFLVVLAENSHIPTRSIQ